MSGSRLAFPAGCAAYADASVEISRYDVADPGSLQEWDVTAQWGGLLAAVSGDCILVRATVTAIDGTVVAAENSQDCS